MLQTALMRLLASCLLLAVQVGMAVFKIHSKTLHAPVCVINAMSYRQSLNISTHSVAVPPLITKHRTPQHSCEYLRSVAAALLALA